MEKLGAVVSTSLVTKEEISLRQVRIKGMQLSRILTRESVLIDRP